MKILQRYILTELTGPFLMAVVVLTFVLLATQLFKLMEYLVSASISPFLLARFLGTLIPPILMLTLPMGLLVAVLLVFGRLSADRELMAIRTSGVNLKMLYFPVVIVGLVCTLLLFYFTHFLVPQNRLGLTQLKGEVTYLLQSALPAGRWHQPDAAGSDQVSLMFEDREGTSTLRKVGMHMLTSEGNDSGAKDQVIIMADRGWISPLPGSEGLHFLLKHGYIHIYDQYNPAAYVMVRFNRLDRDIRLEVDRVKKRGQDPEETPTPGLQSRLDFALSGAAADSKFVNTARTEIWQRYSMPFAALTFILLGMPLGVLGRTAGKAAGFSMAFGLIFVYYILLKWGASLGLDGHPLAFLAIMSPNIILSVVGLFFMWKTIKT